VQSQKISLRNVRLSFCSLVPPALHRRLTATLFPELRMIRAVSDAAFPPGKSPLGELMASPHLLLDSLVESPGTTAAAELPQAKG